MDAEKEALARGIEKGIEEGLEQGIEKKSNEIIKNMLSNNFTYE